MTGSIVVTNYFVKQKLRTLQGLIISIAESAALWNVFLIFRDFCTLEIKLFF